MKIKVCNRACATLGAAFRPLSSPGRRWLSIALSLLILAAGLAWWISARPDDGSWDRVFNTGVLRVGLDASFPPFEMLDTSGQVTGYDADLAAALAKRLGVRAEFVNVGFDALYDALLAERIDVVISSLPYDARRTQDVAYSLPYFNAGQQLLMCTAEVSHTLGIEGLAGWLAYQTIAVEWGSMADMEARRLQRIIPGLRIVALPTARQALASLVEGRVRAAIADGVITQEFLRSQAGRLCTATQLTDEPYVVATRRRARRLAAAIGQALEELRQAGTFEALQAKWFQATDLAPD